jgi:hypothetical protein
VIIEIDPELLMALVNIVDGNVEVLEEGYSAIAVKAVRSAVNGLQVLVGGWCATIEFDDEEEVAVQIATDDPATCGHPRTLDLPGQLMCATCGASHNEDDTWSVWG